MAVGYDIRLSSPQLATALKRGLIDCGSDVLDIGLCGTEGSYFATFAEKLDGGIMVTASHNPPDYNGMKFVREEARPISADTGLMEMRRLIETGRLPGKAARPGSERAARHPRGLPRAPARLRRASRSCARSRWSSTPATAAPA